MATHSSVLVWRIPGMGEPGGLPSMGSHRIGYDCSDLAAKDIQITKKHMKKILSHTNYWRNANQNYNEVSLHTSQNGHYQKVYKQYMLERV